MKEKETEQVIVLAGNPNVGKSTLFNALTGRKQHTGNWAGKTVECAKGICSWGGKRYVLVDLPGCYSLTARSREEEAARDYLYSAQPGAVVVVCDATCLDRNLALALQIAEICANVIVCVNLLDEAKRKKIQVDLRALEESLGLPVVGITARKKEGLDGIFRAIERLSDIKSAKGEVHAHDPFDCQRKAKAAARAAVRLPGEDPDRRDRKLDAVFTGRRTGFLVMFGLLFLVFWLTLCGANYPSALLSEGLSRLGSALERGAQAAGMPWWLKGALLDGVYRVTSWVVAVMLPPMAIFFPLFSLLEDSGYLPRAAYNLDGCFRKCRSCGKQALTMCMGFGCNAVGVTGCRIIDSPRERLVAILTNSLVPCNGRFPAMAMLITAFLVGTEKGIAGTVLTAGILAVVITVGILMTFLISWLLSVTLLKGVPSSFVLELVPYRKPQAGKVLLEALRDRALAVLGRAVATAAPAGLVIWLLANVTAGGGSLLDWGAQVLEPLGRLMGLDGVILLAFLLGIPANEIVLPLALMCYLSQGSLMEVGSLDEIRAVLTANGWTWATAVSMLLFSLMHWPCGTTCLTIYQETRSGKWTLAAILIPTAAGMAACILFTAAVRGLGMV